MFTAFSWVARGQGQITVISPASNVAIQAADDYATQAFQDPWDMSQWTDLGWYTYGSDQPASNLSNINVSGGMFTATSANANPNLWLLDTYTPGTAPLGKIGSLYPIDSTKYRRFLVRMNLSGPALTNPPGAGQYANFIWSNHSLYQSGGPSTSTTFLTYPGWWIYSVDIPTLGLAASGFPVWSAGPVDSLRFNPVYIAGVNISMDWARLVADTPGLYQTIAWTGSGAVDIYLDNDTNFGNGYVGQIAASATGNSFQFYAGGLPKGTYYVAIRPAGSSGAPSYSPGAWLVDDIPTLTFAKPDPEGSADDFATVQLNNPWDMDAVTDIDYTVNVSGMNITHINAQDQAGNSLGSIRVLAGTTAQVPDDPEIFPLWWGKRGQNYKIDTSRYRILSLKWGMQKSRDLNAGSIGRIIWHVSVDAQENVSNDIALHSLPNVNVVEDLITDMKTLQLEDPPGSPSRSGWTGLVDGFRVKPDEFSTPVNFYIQSIKLSALEQADASYTVQWNYGYQGSASPSLSLYWDSTGSGFAGTAIATGVSPSSGAYTWNTSQLANGTYYIYAQLMNGSAIMNRSYAKWPIVVSHGSQTEGTMALDRGDVWFGGTNSGTTMTDPQTVYIVAAPGVSWSVSANQSFITLSPSSGTGSGSFTIGIQNSGLPSAGNLAGTVTVSSPNASNSPQYVQVHLTVKSPGATSVPIGSFDTPSDGSTALAGNVPVTGWALDDVEVTGLQVWRDPISGEAAQSNGLVYVGDAVFISGARPDVQASYGTYPLNDRAGWGYMMLTNFLPNNGNGTFKLHAIALDKDGHSKELGTKTITCDNAHATKPFGTIDTPGQGATVSGSYVNYGWALTRMPNSIPTDGHTISVYVDGQALGHPVYNNYRSDIATLFPGYANSGGAVGYFNLDTTQLTNGLHTISWAVTDSANQSDGIGSRYFTVLNGGGSSAPAPLAERTRADDGPSSAWVRFVKNPQRIQPMTLRRGYDSQAPEEAVAEDATGTLSITSQQLGRIELRIGASEGYQLTEGRRRPLPLGSILRNGVFYWQIGPAFLGDFHLVFLQDQPDGSLKEIPVTVHINSKK